MIDGGKQLSTSLVVLVILIGILMIVAVRDLEYFKSRKIIFKAIDGSCSVIIQSCKAIKTVNGGQILVCDCGAESLEVFHD